MLTGCQSLHPLEKRYNEEGIAESHRARFCREGFYPAGYFVYRRLSMTKQAKKENLLKIKQRLAEKCERLAKLTPSRPKRKTLLGQATRYRHQAAQIAKR